MKKRIIISALSVLLLVVIITIAVSRKQIFSLLKNDASNPEQTSCEQFIQSVTTKPGTEENKTQEPTPIETTKSTSSCQKQSVQQAFETAKENGFCGNAKDWIIKATVDKKDSDDQSVFQIAQANGFDGTREEWANQLLQPGDLDANDQVSDVSVTDDGHIVVTIGDGVTIETVDMVTPTEPEKSSYTVTFLDHSDVVLKIQQVYQGDFATPPQIENDSFLGWNGNYVDVRHNETVKAVHRDSKNVFRVSSVQDEPGNTVSMLIQLDGEVLLCGLDMIINYDSCLELVSVNDELDMDVVVNANEAERSVRFNFSAAMNKKRPMEMMELTLRIAKENARTCSVTLSADAVKVLDENLVKDADYTIINGVVFVDE